jgi:hypothetical protein
VSSASHTPEALVAAEDTESAATGPTVSAPVVSDQVRELSLREIFSARSRRQRYLDVEAALALAQADLG